MSPRGENENSVTSTLGIHYFTNRREPLISGDAWLEGKRKDDNIEGLWRVHNKLFDLENFIKKHPGGPEWLRMTKGTDITEAFEAHHIKGVAENLLSRYFVKEATSPRVSPLTFDDNGFYRTLKERIAKELPKIPKHVIQQSKLFADITTAIYLLFFVLSVYSESYLLGVLTGYVLALTVNISHNFIHQRDNFRMYYLDLSMMSSREFRITHALSHHLFPNSIHDLEISMYEPVVHFLPQKKSTTQKWLSWFYALLLFPILSIKGYIFTILDEKKVRINSIIPWLAFTFVYLVTGQEILICLQMFLWIILWSSLIFSVIGKTAAHHHPEIFHDGDTHRPPEEMDFGVYQLDAVSDRPNIQGSPFLVISNFGDHALHHLFPTLDHGILDYLYPVFLQTCIEFGVEWKLFSSKELVKGAFQQLARDRPNKNPPQPLKKRK